MKKSIYKLLTVLMVVLVISIFTGCNGNGNGDKDTVDTSPVDMMTLPPLKDQFSDYFDIGNIFNPGDVSGGQITNNRLTHHYNVLTAENHMKPDALFTRGADWQQLDRNAYTFTRADEMVDAAIASGFKVVGHTLLWHSQIPRWQRNLGADNTSPETTLQYMREYITEVVTHFKGRVYKWDVLNEVFPDGGYNANSDWRNVMRTGNQGNPWFQKIGADFVYEGFKAARLADPDTILYYNDYNMDNVAKATMVRNMVRDVNEQWRGDPDYDGKHLIQGIGMQSHHNTNVSASSVRASLNLFKPLGVRISISELDVLAQSYQDFERVGQGPNRQDQTTVTTQGRETQTRLYGEYFQVFLDFADIIERVTFWGLTDNLSWRSAGLPLPFDSEGKAKPAYYRIIEALSGR